ncbi:copia protein [Trifolium pratense]|uniref:Copia protein n=1 Tax=Trifolium pratense TaxID=57577 RepID=A0A2K3L6U6_TRIPR|nr:copia protein [Trifolium pratense]
MRVLRYLKSSPGQGIVLPKENDLTLVAYCDMSINSKVYNRIFNEAWFTPVSWKTKKQTIVSKSSSEAEYRAMNQATSEVIWIRNLLSSLQVQCNSPTVLHCDNQAAIHIAANPAGTISPSYIPTKKQQADIFTKALGAKSFHELMVKLGAHDPRPPT